MIPRIKPIFNNEILQVLNSVNSDEINSAAENFKSELKKNYGFNEIIFFESGRSALSCCLKQIKTEKKFEVIISAFTCSVVADAVINSGCRPVFADCDLSDFSLDVDSMINCVSDKTLAIIYPHHFGIASKGVLKAADYVKEKKIFLIEDIAQSLFCSVNAKYAGSFGDLAVMSFGLDKPISCGQGGALLINNKNSLINCYNKPEPETKETQDILSLILTDYLFNPENYKNFSQLESAERFIKKNNINTFDNINETLLKFENHISKKKEYKTNKLKNIICSVLNLNAKIKEFIISEKKIFVLKKNFEKFKDASLIRNSNAVNWRNFIVSKYSDKIIPFEISENDSTHNILKYPAVAKEKKIAEEVCSTFKKNFNIEIGNFNWPYILPERKAYKKYSNKSAKCKNAFSICGKVLNFPVHIDLPQFIGV